MKRDWIDLVFALLWWVLLMVGFLTENAWTFAVAAFFILLDKLDDLGGDA